MDERGWMIQIYAISTSALREEIRALLDGIDSLAVQTTRRERDLLLIVESRGDEQAWCIHRLITSTDPDATLLHTSTGADPVRHRAAKVGSLRA